uniref:Uncharacterized protein n=1 Tax=Peronospora matthiolae TaxID=2874970 RepID=A0AAV1TK15_9STRA
MYVLHVAKTLNFVEYLNFKEVLQQMDLTFGWFEQGALLENL